MAPKNSRWKHLALARESKQAKRSSEMPCNLVNECEDDEYHFSDDEPVINDSTFSAVESSFLVWKAGAGSHLRAVYSGSSRTSKWRLEKHKNALLLSATSSRKITEFFTPNENTADAVELSSEESRVQQTKMPLADALILLQKFTGLRCNAQVEKRLSGVSKYDFLRYLAIEKYLQLLHNGNGSSRKMSASIAIASEHFPKQNCEHQARKIRNWADFFLKTQKLPVHRQGAHIKTKSLIHDEDVIRECRGWLRSQRADVICGSNFSLWIEEKLHVLLNLPKPIVVSESTARRWMHSLGLTYGGFSKGLYHDGHEREDVVQFRHEFLDRMLYYETRMRKYGGDEMSDITEPESTSKRLVLVTHDESCFSSNDGKATIWFDQDNRPIRPKGEGRSIMVSEFLCECHGPMKLSQSQRIENMNLPFHTAVVTHPGKNADGYWTNSDLAKQLEHALIPIFKVLHPDCDALIMFDNSQNHRALPPDALNANALNLSDGGKNVKPQRSGWYEEDGVKIAQSMQTSSGVQKGVRTILKERGLWQNYYSLKGAREVLSQQPDFAEQTGWLEEIVRRHPGFIIDFYPKFHCEFNFIEMYWAACKSYTRRNCTYSFKDLKVVVPIALESVSVQTIRRFARKCFRYMDAYRVLNEDGNRLTVQQAEYAVKKYKSHRSIPLRILNADCEFQ